MEVFRFNILTDEEYQKREEFKNHMSLCPDCHHELEFTYQQDATYAVLEESASCPFCLFKPALARHRIN